MLARTRSVAISPGCWTTSFHLSSASAAASLSPSLRLRPPAASSKSSSVESTVHRRQARNFAVPIRRSRAAQPRSENARLPRDLTLNNDARQKLWEGHPCTPPCRDRLLMNDGRSVLQSKLLLVKSTIFAPNGTHASGISTARVIRLRSTGNLSLKVQGPGNLSPEYAQSDQSASSGNLMPPRPTQQMPPGTLAGRGGQHCTQRSQGWIFPAFAQGVPYRQLVFMS